MRGCFVTGTDTGVGKTVLAAAIAAALRARGVRVAAFKPVVTGLDEPEPGRPADHELLGAVDGARAVGGHAAALRARGLAAPGRGARRHGDRAGRAARRGGPRGRRGRGARRRGRRRAARPDLRRTTASATSRSTLGLPVVVAARPGLGTINHTLLTVEAARAAGLDVRAVVLTPWPERAVGHGALEPRDDRAARRASRSRRCRPSGSRPPTSPRPERRCRWTRGSARRAMSRAATATGSRDRPRRRSVDGAAARAAGRAADAGTAGAPSPDAAPRSSARTCAASASCSAPRSRPTSRGSPRSWPRPEVGRWWMGETEALTRTRVLEGEEDTTIWVVLADGEIIGMVQAWEETEPEYRHGGIDIALHPDWHGRGLGADTVAHGRPPPHRRPRPPPHHDRPGRGEHGRDPQLRADRLPARRDHARVRARQRRDMARRTPHGPARRRAALIGGARTTRSQRDGCHGARWDVSPMNRDRLRGPMDRDESEAHRVQLNRHHHLDHQPPAEAPGVRDAGRPPGPAAPRGRRHGRHVVSAGRAAADRAQRSPRAATCTIDVSISHSTGATSSV